MIAKSLIPILAFLIGGDEIIEPPDEITIIETEIRQQLNSLETDAEFTLMVEADNGRRFTHSIGNSTITTEYQSASTSKLVTAAVVLWFSRQGHIELDANPQDFIDGWPTSGELAQLTLWQLLSFTSGLANEPLCINFSMSNFQTCVANIADANPMPTAPGEHFHYGSAHMQVAGGMLINALELNSWQEVFSRFKQESNLFASAAYVLPSSSNPRLAGGMRWHAEEYMGFLESLFRRTLFDQAGIDTLTQDRLLNVTIDYSPAQAGWQEDWHYGLGVWLECRSDTYNCSSATRFSSPGAFGAYPFWDEEHLYFGILARQGDLGTAAQGIETVRFIEVLLEQWASLNQKP